MVMGWMDNDMASKKKRKILYISSVCLFLSFFIYLFKAPSIYDKYMAFTFLFGGILLGKSIQEELSDKVNNTNDNSNNSKNG